MKNSAPKPNGVYARHASPIILNPRTLVGLLICVPVGGANTVLSLIGLLVLFRVGAAARTRQDRLLVLVGLCTPVGVMIGTLIARGPVFSALTVSVAVAGAAGLALYVIRLGQNRGGREVYSFIGWTGVGLVILSAEQWGTIVVNPWKYGIGMGATIAVLAVRAYYGRPTPGWITVVLLAVSALTVSRNLGISILIAACVALLQDRLRGGLLRVSAVGVAVAVFVLASGALSDIALSTGAGQTIEDRFVAQEHYNPNPLLGARIEIPMSLAAIQQSPLVGWGVDAEPTLPLIAGAERLAAQMGYRVDSSLAAWWTQGDRIYTHSELFTLWIDGGLLAVVAPLGALVVLLVAFATTLAGRGQLSTLTLFLACEGVWNLLFSPFAIELLIFASLAVGIFLFERAENLSSVQVRISGASPNRRRDGSTA